MRRVVINVMTILAVAGCGARQHPSDIPVAPCAQPRDLAAAPLPQEQGVYRAGPLTLAVGEDLAQMPPGRSGSDAIVLVRGERAVTMTVMPDSRLRFALQFAGQAASTAVRFPACGGRQHRFGGGITFAGPGCVQVEVAPGGEMLIPIGNSLRRCPNRLRSHRLSSRALPYLGVSCPVGNVITCDRVGVSVSLHRPAALVVVRLAGRTVTLSPPLDPRSDLWLGYLDDAGLRHGPLAVQTRGDKWYGEPFVTPRVVVTVFFSDGTSAMLAGEAQLHAGFG
jgi:hypothetical protein